MVVCVLLEGTIVPKIHGNQIQCGREVKLARHWCPLDDRLAAARISLLICLRYSTLVGLLVKAVATGLSEK